MPAEPSVLLYDAVTADPVPPGPSSVIRSSAHLPWNGFLVEQHRLHPGERPAAVSTRYIVTILRSRMARVEVFHREPQSQTYSKAAGTVTLTPRGPVPRLVCRDTALLLVCAFHRTTLEQVAAGFDRPLPELNLETHVQDEHIVRLAHLLDDEATAGAPSGNLYAESLAHALAVRFLMGSSGGSDTRFSSNPKETRSPLPPTLLRRAVEAMQAAVADPPGLQALADLTGYSARHFSRMFRLATGTTPHRYLLGLRIERAQQLLRGGAHSLADIAALTGFATQAHFTSTFRRFSGLSPAAWRREYLR